MYVCGYVFASEWITVVRFCCFRGLLFRSLGGGGGGGVDNVQFATITMLLPVSQQPGSASGVRSAAMPFGAGVCTPTFLEAFSNLLVLIVAGLPPIPALRDFWDASFQELQETHRVLCLSVDETSAEAMVSSVLLGPGQPWVFPWERLEGFSADLCRLSEPLKSRPGTAAVASCVRILRNVHTASSIFPLRPSTQNSN